MRDCGAEDESVRLETKNGLRDIVVQIKSSPRSRNFRMWVAGSGRVVVSKPSRASKAAAREFLLSNAAWLEKRLDSFKPPLSLLGYLSENPFVYADGKKFRIWLKPSRSGGFFVEDAQAGEVVFAYDEADAEGSLQKTFLKYAAEKISALAKRHSDETGMGFGRISVRGQSSRWASRSSTGTLSFNWRMVLLPCELQDYIVCHELAHVRFMDHSVSFWIFLNRLLPNAKSLDARLSKEGSEVFSVAR